MKKEVFFRVFFCFGQTTVSTTISQKTFWHHIWKRTGVSNKTNDGWTPCGCFGFKVMVLCMLAHCHSLQGHLNRTKPSLILLVFFLLWRVKNVCCVKGPSHCQQVPLLCFQPLVVELLFHLNHRLCLSGTCSKESWQRSFLTFKRRIMNKNPQMFSRQSQTFTDPNMIYALSLLAMQLFHLKWFPDKNWT